MDELDCDVFRVGRAAACPEHQQATASLEPRGHIAAGERDGRGVVGEPFDWSPTLFERSDRRSGEPLGVDRHLLSRCTIRP